MKKGREGKINGSPVSNSCTKRSSSRSKVGRQHPDCTEEPNPFLQQLAVTCPATAGSQLMKNGLQMFELQSVPDLSSILKTLVKVILVILISVKNISEIGREATLFKTMT